MGMHPYECAASCKTCGEESFADSVRDTVGAMDDAELQNIMDDVNLYPSPTGLSEAGETVVLEAVETEIAMRKIFG